MLGNAPSYRTRKPAPDEIVRVDDEGVIAGHGRAPGDLRHDGGIVAHRRLAQHPAGEAAADDALVDVRLPDRQRPLRMQPGQPGRRAGPARRAVDLAIGEDRDVAAVGSSGWRASDDRAVDAVQAWFERMHDLAAAPRPRA